MNHVQIKAIARAEAARIRNILNYDDDFELQDGLSLQATFPPEAAYRMDDNHPDRIALHEFLDNLDQQLVIHERVRDLLEAEGVRHVEYLPVRVLNHKDREVKARYFIANTYPLVDCIDQDKTRFKWNPLNDQAMMNVENLTLFEERIPPDFKLLRLKYLPSAMLIHRELAQKMKEARFRGFELVELSDYRWY
jgi:hypothetical protein